MQQETEALRQYVDLYLLKKPRSRNVDFYTEGNLNGWQIAPMLLVNIVENALKHSNLEQNPDAWVKIHADISTEGVLKFSTENSASPNAPVNNAGGIGLANLRRQLEINYPENHVLEIKNEDKTFGVTLRLNLKKA
jgi:LytS/YehU family sensor histidine kinase